MKKKSLIIFSASALLACVAYVLAAAIPLYRSIETMSSEIGQLEAQVGLCESYSENARDYENKIAELAASPLRLYSALTVNENNVYEKIGELCSELSLTLDSIEMSACVAEDKYVVYPVSLSVTGEASDIISFIGKLENSYGGSFVIASACLDGTVRTVNAVLEIKLYCPAV